MSDSPLLTETRNGVRTITINRPDKLNALNSATLDALHRAFDDAAEAEEVRVVVSNTAEAGYTLDPSDRADILDTPDQAPRSFPAKLPVMRLDRIYMRGFSVEHAEIHYGEPWSRISDHAALSASLNWNDGR